MMRHQAVRVSAFVYPVLLIMTSAGIAKAQLCPPCATDQAPMSGGPPYSPTDPRPAGDANFGDDPQELGWQPHREGRAGAGGAHQYPMHRQTAGQGRVRLARRFAAIRGAEVARYSADGSPDEPAREPSLFRGCTGGQEIIRAPRPHSVTAVD